MENMRTMPEPATKIPSMKDKHIDLTSGNARGFHAKAGMRELSLDEAENVTAGFLGFIPLIKKIGDWIVEQVNS